VILPRWTEQDMARRSPTTEMLPEDLREDEPTLTPHQGTWESHVQGEAAQAEAFSRERA
jgi:hypothetical protein